VFLLAFERAGIVFLRSLDDVTILAASPAALAAGLGSSRTRWFPWSTLFLNPHIPLAQEIQPDHRD